MGVLKPKAHSLSAVQAALVDAACVAITADARIERAELTGLVDAVVERFDCEAQQAALAIMDAFARLAIHGVDASLAGLAGRLSTAAERESCYAFVLDLVYADAELAGAEIELLARLADALALDRETVDGLSTRGLTIAAWYPEHWARAPALAMTQINDALERWGHSHGLFDSHEILAVLRALDLDVFARHVFAASSDPERLLLAAEWVFWGYLIDDAAEALAEQGRASAIAAMTEPYLAYFAAPHPPRRLGRLAGDRMERWYCAFVEMTWAITSACGDPEYLDKYRQSHVDYWRHGIAGELAAADAPLGLEHRIATRVHTAFIQIIYDLAEFACRCPVPKALRDRPRVKRVRDLLSLVDGMFNDLISYDRERPHDNLANVALAVRRELGADDRAALTTTAALHDAIVSACEREMLALSAEEPALGPYFDAIRHSIHGLAVWQLRSARYRNRHRVIVTHTPASNPGIDPEQLRRLCAMAGVEAPGER